MKKLLILLIISFISLQSFSQEKPKLVVGIVVDQMRYDYVYRFWDNFGDEGFKRLINQGYFFRNCQFGYLPTYTGPGHASIFTGTTPAVHGIIANDWYDKKSGNYIYCAGDGDMHTVCNCEQKNIDVQSEDGKMSPHHMLTTTFADELKLFNNNSKVFGISLKDRGAILPAGHSANGAYWMDSEGKWITSSFYMEALPDYIQKINETKPAQHYLEGIWEVKGKFNHNLLTQYSQQGGSAIKSTPYGNTILKDLAIEILKKEKLGQGNQTDILTLSFSSTDYIGHQYGPHAAEIEDTYLRLDKDLEEIIKQIDNTVGSDNVVLFITADHGVVSEPNELLKRNIPAGYFDKSIMQTELLSHLNTIYGQGDWIKDYSNNHLFLNHDLILEKDIDLEEIERKCAKFLLKYEWVKNTYTATQLNENEYQNSFHSLVQRGYNQKRSGDVIVSLQTGWLKSHWEAGGTTHGSSYSYDTHVPLIFWGGNIPQGQADRKVNIRDIAPTISTLLGISYPNGCTGNPLPEITQ
ncbi:MAG: alkaline phosphatase [Flavobacteriales bacterium]|nr:alkaline phosphatase [Flavobacteriales bacterium]|tara:strand:- start:5166 stop:6731 length:1566 start_codon:yes stop_codon:yes gene_type:complete